MGSKNSDEQCKVDKYNIIIFSFFGRERIVMWLLEANENAGNSRKLKRRTTSSKSCDPKCSIKLAADVFFNFHHLFIFRRILPTQHFLQKHFKQKREFLSSTCIYYWENFLRQKSKEDFSWSFQWCEKRFLKWITHRLIDLLERPLDLLWGQV